MPPIAKHLSALSPSTKRGERTRYMSGQRDLISEAVRKSVRAADIRRQRGECDASQHSSSQSEHHESHPAPEDEEGAIEGAAAPATPERGPTPKAVTPEPGWDNFRHWVGHKHWDPMLGVDPLAVPPAHGEHSPSLSSPGGLLLRMGTMSSLQQQSLGEPPFDALADEPPAGAVVATPAPALTEQHDAAHVIEPRGWSEAQWETHARSRVYERVARHASSVVT